MKRVETSEHAIQIQIMDYLAMAYPHHYLWRNNSGALLDRRMKLVRYGKVGSADILGVAPDGRFIALEIKRPSTKSHTTPAQAEFLDEVAKRGGYAGVVTCTEDVDRVLKPQQDQPGPVLLRDAA